MNIAIIGYGWVGKAVHKLFPEAYIYTETQGTKAKVNKADIAFICVPTPLSEEGNLDTSIVADIVHWLKCPLIIIRSTVNPGDCNKWEAGWDKQIVYQPEYLGETPNHPLLDEAKTPFMVLGGSSWNRKKAIDLYTTVYNANIKIRQVTLEEAEVIKLTENRAIAFKMMQMQELYDACELAQIDYYTIRDAVYGDDPRFNLWFTMIYPEKRGFHNSKCLKKDVPAWSAWAERNNLNPRLTNALIEKSKIYGR